MKQTHLIIFCLSILCSGYSFAQKTTPEPYKEIQIEGIYVFGKSIDNQTRCVHWHSALDVIAIKFKCCGKYYPCFSCHDEDTDHQHQVWPKTDFDEKAILCGVCGHELSVKDYMASNNTCPKCNAGFNPGCSNHYYLYFETDESLPKTDEG